MFGKGVEFRFCLGFHWRDFPKTLHLTPSAHALRKVQVWSDRTINEDILFGEENIFSTVSRHSWEGFS
jgi:hypothetical protein